MTDNQDPDALREALQFLIRSDIEAKPKRLLIDTILEVLAVAEAELSKRSRARQHYPEWQTAEVETATAYLQNKVAGGWQHADEIVTRLARELHRDADDVRGKAIELGFGAAVDYRLAKAHDAAGRGARDNAT